MIRKTEGIVLNYIKYGDTSIITRIFTEELGYGSYIVNAVRSQRPKKNIGHFQPFSLIELVVYVKESRNLQRISELKGTCPLHHIHQDFIKTSITLFLTEVLSRLLESEQSAYQDLYYYTRKSVISLDNLQTGVENFHLQFLLKIAPFLGFAIDEFDTLFTSIDKLAPSGKESDMLQKLINEPYGLTMDINRAVRNQLLDAVLNYYKYHAHIPKPKSLDVLRSVLN